jgi:hypothetical protein
VDYRDLDRLLGDLQRSVETDRPQRGYWKELWSLVGEIRTGLRETRYPTAEDRTEARQRLDRLVSEAKTRSDREKQDRETREKAWEEKKETSQRALGRVQSKVAGATPVGELERMVGTLVLGPLLALESMLRSVLGLEQLDEVYEDLKSCSATLKQAWQIFNDSKADLLPGDKADAYRQLNEAQERLNAAWDAWRAAKGRAHDERRRQHEERQRAWDERQRDRNLRIQANIEKLEGKIEKAEDALERRRAHLSKLEDDYSSAWNDGFKDRCQQWINEEQDRIRDIEASIDRLREWLREERTKLRD